MAIFIKSDVKRGWKEPMIKGIKVLAKLYDRYNEDLMITSGTEGKHMQMSHHYIGWAVDFRKGSRSKGDIMTALRNAGESEVDWDIVDGYATNHYHLEYDPKGLAKNRSRQMLLDYWADKNKKGEDLNG